MLNDGRIMARLWIILSSVVILVASANVAVASDVERWLELRDPARNFPFAE
jgi:hypothetical protein